MFVPQSVLASVGLVLLAALPSWVPGCQRQNQYVPPPPPEVMVAAPVVRDIVDTIEFTGTTKATATVDLRARVNGYLEKISFEDGTMVSKGDLLFVIEQAPFQVALDQAKADRTKAQASLQLAEANFSRSSQLRQKGAITQADYDVAQANLATAKAGVEAAQAAVKQAELNLQYTEIRAPISGRIGRHLVDVGNLIYAEQTSLAIIESLDPIYAYFNVSERDLLRFMAMLRANELPDPDKQPPVLYLGLANESDFPHKGTLDFREFGVDPTTGTALRRGIFPNRDRSLIPGLFVRIRAPIGDPVPRLLVEDRAIGTDQRGDFVLTVNADNVVEHRPVTLGIATDGLRVVLDGLTKDDRVIVNGLQRARPGAKVQPKPAAK